MGFLLLAVYVDVVLKRRHVEGFSQISRYSRILRVNALRVPGDLYRHGE